MKITCGNEKGRLRLPPGLAGLDYFDGAGVVSPIESDEAEESVAFLDFLPLFFLLDFFSDFMDLAGLAELSDDDMEEAAGEDGDVSVVAGAWAKAEAANRPATRVAISFFMFNPLRSGKSNDSDESFRITARPRIG